MPTLNIAIGVSGVGGSISRSTPRTADGGGAIEVAVPVGQAGTLTTRSDDDTGIVTAGSGSHGISSSDVIDLFWVGGARFGITVGTVSGTSIPIGGDDSGTGDVLPASSTAVVVSPRVAFNAAIDGDALAAIAIQQVFLSTSETAESRVTLLDSGDSEIEGITLAANTPRLFDITGGDTNVFTGNPITDGFISNGSTTNAATLKILWVQDITP